MNDQLVSLEIKIKRIFELTSLGILILAMILYALKGDFATMVFCVSLFILNLSRLTKDYVQECGYEAMAYYMRQNMIVVKQFHDFVEKSENRPLRKMDLSDNNQ